MTENKDPSFEELRSSIEILGEQLLRCVIPIFRHGKSGKPELHGTGFLVEGHAGKFLVSAAQVFDPLKSGCDLFFCIGSKRLRKVVGAFRLAKATPKN